MSDLRDEIDREFVRRYYERSFEIASVGAERSVAAYAIVSSVGAIGAASLLVDGRTGEMAWRILTIIAVAAWTTASFAYAYTLTPKSKTPQAREVVGISGMAEHIREELKEADRTQRSRVRVAFILSIVASILTVACLAGSTASATDSAKEYRVSIPVTDEQMVSLQAICRSVGTSVTGILSEEDGRKVLSIEADQCDPHRFSLWPTDGQISDGVVIHGLD